MTTINLNPTIEQATNLDDYNVGFYTGMESAVRIIKEQAPGFADNDDLSPVLSELRELAQSYVSPQDGDEVDHAFTTDTRRDLAYIKLKAARGESTQSDLRRIYEKFQAYHKEHGEETDG